MLEQREAEDVIDIRYCNICGWPGYTDDVETENCTGCKILKHRNKVYSIKDEDDVFQAEKRGR